MELFGFQIPDWTLIPIFLLGTILATSGLDRLSANEEKRNDKVPPPSDHQIKWDLRHIRQDLRLIVLLLSLILFTLWIRN